MIKKYKFKEFTVYEKDEKEKYLKIFRAFLEGKIQSKKLRASGKRKVFFFEFEAKKYILKYDENEDKRLEKKILNFFKGRFYNKLIYQVEAAKQKACDLTNDIFLVAEEVHFFRAKQSYILAEYLEGETLEDYKARIYADEIAKALKALHSFSLASNDFHHRNLLLTEDRKIKIIDLSNYGSLEKCKAEDVIAAKKIFDIDIGYRNFYYYLLVFKNKIREMKRKILRKDKKIV